jgi:hypothetical protein
MMGENNMDLAEKYVEYMGKLARGEVKGNTWNDFYDYCDIPPKDRTDFASAAILKQVLVKEE